MYRCIKSDVPMRVDQMIKQILKSSILKSSNSYHRSAVLYECTFVGSLALARNTRIHCARGAWALGVARSHVTCCRCDANRTKPTAVAQLRRHIAYGTLITNDRRCALRWVKPTSAAE